MLFEIYDGHTEDGKGSRRYAIAPEALQDEYYKEEYGEYPTPDGWFEHKFTHNVVKVGEIEVEGDIDLLCDSFPVDGD